MACESIGCIHGTPTSTRGCGRWHHRTRSSSTMALAPGRLVALGHPSRRPTGTGAGVQLRHPRRGGRTVDEEAGPFGTVTCGRPGPSSLLQRYRQDVGCIRLAHRHARQRRQAGASSGLSDPSSHYRRSRPKPHIHSSLNVRLDVQPNATFPRPVHAPVRVTKPPEARRQDAAGTYFVHCVAIHHSRTPRGSHPTGHTTIDSENASRNHPTRSGHGFGE